MNITYAENIIIGAGISGLTFAALCARNKHEVLILESHTALGGCAGYFQRQKFVFDVGATTLSGINGLTSLKKVINLLDLKLNLKHCDPGLVIHLDDKVILRHSHLELWTKEQERFFPSLGIENLWKDINQKCQKIYRLIKYSESIPVDNFSQFLKLVDGDLLLKIQMTKYLFRSFENVYPLIQKDRKYLQMIDEMLLIAAQNTSKHVPSLIAYLALSYLEDSWYCYGGMKELNMQLKSSLEHNHGAIQFNNEVLEIKKRFNYFEIKANRKIFRAKNVFSSIPIWNTNKIASSLNIQRLKSSSNKFIPQWGAITGYFALKIKHEMLQLYHQIHLEKKFPYTTSDSVFVSFSPLDDLKRNDGVYQTVTVSIHIKLTDFHEVLKKIPREDLKDLWQKEFEQILKLAFNTIEDIKCFGIGDPKTFQHFTKRLEGTVGGISHDVKNFILQYPNFSTGEKNFYQFGDTTFPGQGIVGVMQGALNLFNRVMLK